MKQKYINEIYNLVTNTDENEAMSGKELRARINVAFINDTREALNKAAQKKGGAFIPLAQMFTTGKRMYEVKY